VIKTILLILVALLLSGCPSIYYISDTSIVEDKLVKLQPPKGKFYSFRETFKPVHKRYDGSISFMKRDIPGTRYVIDFDSFNESYITDVKRYDYLFNPQLDWKEYEKELQAKDNMLEVEARWHGYRLQKVYLNNLACGLVSFSRSPFDYMASSASKNYSLECGYYAKDGTKKVFDIYHNYRINLSKKAFTHGDVVGKNYQGKYSPVMFMEQDFQRSAKYMIDSIELKEVDIPRMKREGLYHEGKGKEFHYPVW